MDRVDAALQIVESGYLPDAPAAVLAAEVRKLREVKRQVGQVRDAMERGVYGSAEEAADVLSRALRGAL